MEEKERYEIVYFDNDTRWKIIDNKTKQEVGDIDDMIKLLNQQDQKIADLEAKLEQSQKEKELDNAFWKQECDSLQKALAEKEKEIEKRMMSFEKSCQEYYNSNEYKTDFAIEKLEKVKEFCNNPLVQNVYGNIPEFRVENFIDNQIKELKEKTNVKD